MKSRNLRHAVVVPKQHNMKKLLTILLLVSLTGCGTLTKLRDEKKIKSDSTAVVTNTVKTDIVTIIEEKVDTTVTVKGDSAVVVTPLNTLITEGEIETTNNGTTVKVTYNKETGDIRAVGITAERSVPVTINKKTTTTDKSDSQTNSKVDVKRKEATKKDEVHREQKSKFWWGFAFAIMLLFILVIIILVGRLYFRRI